MKLDPNQSFDINILKGALLTNPNGAEFFIAGVGVDSDHSKVLVSTLQRG